MDEDVIYTYKIFFTGCIRLEVVFYGKIVFCFIWGTNETEIVITISTKIIVKKRKADFCFIVVKINLSKNAFESKSQAWEAKIVY